MKKILEVLQYGDLDIRFNTDIKIEKDPGQIPEIASLAMFSMATRLWGGNENSVLAVLRALSIADLSLCGNRKEMIRFLDEESALLASCFQETAQELAKKGGKVITFPPGIKPTKIKS